jgi:hypothetical protein
MADNELEFIAEADPRATRALRARYAAPGDEAYWAGLQMLVMARIAASTRGSWLQVAAGWAGPGLLAAAAVLVVAAALFQANRGEPEPVTFASMTQIASQPEFIYTEHDAASQREETLRFVVSH